MEARANEVKVASIRKRNNFAFCCKTATVDFPRFPDCRLDIAVNADFMEHFRCTGRFATWRIARSARAMQDCNADNRLRRPGRPMRHRSHREPSHCHARHRAGIWGNSGIYAPCIHNIPFVYVRYPALSGGMCGLASHIPIRAGGASHTATRNDSPVKARIHVVLASS